MVVYRLNLVLVAAGGLVVAFPHPLSLSFLFFFFFLEMPQFILLFLCFRLMIVNDFHCLPYSSLLLSFSFILSVKKH